MNRGGGIGVGSASIVLIFAVLCLTIFSLISFLVTQNTKALIDAEAELVVNYYKADTGAEIVLAKLIQNSDITEVDGVAINIELNHEFDTNQTVVNFSYPIYNSDSKVLFVRVQISQDSYKLLSWRIYDTADWEAENEFNIWLN